jgi:hypothetical protein
MVPAMFEWPRFAAHLNGVHPPEERVVSLLADLAEPAAAASAKDVLSALFEDGALVNEVEVLAPLIHHVGVVAPADLGVDTVGKMLRRSPFRHQVREFKSAVLAKDLSLRFGKCVDVIVVQGSVDAPAARCPSVEIFVADLPAAELDALVTHETGCHVALALAPNGSLGRVLEVLHGHGCWEIPLMRGGPLPNYEIHSSVLYVDVPGRERVRRLEFIAADSAEN